MNTSPKPFDGDVLAWTDIETTGLDHNTDSILEVACILTDTHLNEIAEPFHRIIRYSEGEAARMKAASDPFVADMHEKTGLWGKLPGGSISPGGIDRALLDYVSSVAPKKHQARIAGSSIRLDMNFLDVHAPDTMAHLHYRSLDVSSLMYEAEVTSGFMKPGVDDSTHEALADIRRSMTLLARIRSHYRILPRVPEEMDEDFRKNMSYRLPLSKHA